MPDPARDALCTDARLDDRATAIVDRLSDEAVQQLTRAWEDAVRAQAAAVEEAVDQSLGMVPRLLRRRVLQVLERAMS